MRGEKGVFRKQTPKIRIFIVSKCMENCLKVISSLLTPKRALESKQYFLFLVEFLATILKLCAENLRLLYQLRFGISLTEISVVERRRVSYYSLFNSYQGREKLKFPLAISVAGKSHLTYIFKLYITT